MKRLLITGAAGFVGGALLPAAQAWDVCATYYTRPVLPARGRALALDLQDGAAVRALVREWRPDAVIHTACSNRSAAHIAAIVPAARHLAEAAAECGARFVHLSTDQVFDGENSPYQDDSPLAPLGDYAGAKAAAETIVRALCPTAVIARPALVWGLAPLDHQTRWLVEGVRRGAPVTLFTDEYRCPVFVGDLVAALLELAATPALRGPMNTVGGQALTRWDFGRRLLAALQIPLGPNVVPGTVAGSGLIRARDLRLLNQRAERELQTRLRGVDEVLRDGYSSEGPAVA